MGGAAEAGLTWWGKCGRIPTSFNTGESHTCRTNLDSGTAAAVVAAAAV